MNTSSSSSKAVKKEEDNDIDMSCIPPVQDFNNTAVDSKPWVSNLEHTSVLSQLPPSESEAPSKTYIDKWIAVFEPGITESLKQVNLQCPHSSGQTMSMEKKEVQHLDISQQAYYHLTKKWLSKHLERRYKAGLKSEPPEGLTGQVNLELLNIFTTESNQTELTFDTTLSVTSSQGQDHTRVKVTIPLIGRSYEYATDQGIQAFSIDLQKASITGNLCERIISDLHSVLLGPQHENMVPFRLWSIAPPALSNLHLSVKLRPNPTWHISTQGLRSYSYNECHLDAQVTFSGCTWDNTGQTWKPIMTETLLYCPGSGETSFPVKLPTANKVPFCLTEAMSKRTDLFVLPEPFAG